MGRRGEKEGEGGEWVVGRMGTGQGFGVWFFSFLKKNFLNNFSNPFLNQTFYIFSQPFSQIILKTFKDTQQQTHAFQHDAQALGYFLN
jgi:hypothetical protein